MILSCWGKPEWGILSQSFRGRALVVASLCEALRKTERSLSASTAECAILRREEKKEQ
jgi:hypothetical protein